MSEPTDLHRLFDCPCPVKYNDGTPMHCACPPGTPCLRTRGVEQKRKLALKLIDKQLEGEPVYTRPAPEDFRCFNCRSEPTCPSAWDLYNTGGDCLEEK